MFPTQSKHQYGESYRRKAHNFESYSIYAKDAQYGKRHKPEYRHGKKKWKGVFIRQRGVHFCSELQPVTLKNIVIEFS